MPFSSMILIVITVAALASPPMDQSQDKAKEKPPDSKTEGSATKPPVAVNLPVYKPPLRGAPKGRVGGGTRGLPGGVASVSVLAPDHSGLTTQEQPALYWYLSQPTTTPIELTIIEDWAIKPVLETRLPAPKNAGVQRVRLSQHGVRLQPGVTYRWFVALVPDAENRSKDILAGGLIERSDFSEKVRAQLAQGGPRQAPYILAEAGIWYDALSAISDMIDASPNDDALKQQRAALLEQVGLQEIANYDRRATR